MKVRVVIFLKLSAGNASTSKHDEQKTGVEI